MTHICIFMVNPVRNEKEAYIYLFITIYFGVNLSLEHDEKRSK